MRRVQLLLDDRLDDQAADEARRRGVSKSLVMREALETALGPAPKQESWERFIGCIAGGGDTGNIDEVLYGPLGNVWNK